jgi:hypothetical protein
VVTKDETRHLLALMSEWLNEASILVAVFGIFDHTFSKTDAASLQVGKALTFIGLSLMMFGYAVQLKIMEKKLK